MAELDTMLTGVSVAETLFAVSDTLPEKYVAGSWQDFTNAAGRAAAEYINPDNYSETEYIQMTKGSTRQIIAL